MSGSRARQEACSKSGLGGSWDSMFEHVGLHVGSQNRTQNGSERYQNSLSFLIALQDLQKSIFGPTWPQDGSKMAPRWPQDGSKMASWRVLGPLGGQDGPKMEPRGFQGRKTQFVSPCWGPSWDPIFDIFSTRVVQKRPGDPLA